MDESLADIWEDFVLEDEIDGGPRVEEGKDLSNGVDFRLSSDPVSPTGLLFSCLESGLTFLGEREDGEGSCSAVFGCLCEISLDVWVRPDPDLGADTVVDGGKEGREDDPGYSGGRAWFVGSGVGGGS